MSSETTISVRYRGKLPSEYDDKTTVLVVCFEDNNGVIAARFLNTHQKGFEFMYSTTLDHEDKTMLVEVPGSMGIRAAKTFIRHQWMLKVTYKVLNLNQVPSDENACWSGHTLDKAIAFVESKTDRKTPVFPDLFILVKAPWTNDEWTEVE